MGDLIDLVQFRQEKLYRSRMASMTPAEQYEQELKDQIKFWRDQANDFKATLEKAQAEIARSQDEVMKVLKERAQLIHPQDAITSG